MFFGANVYASDNDKQISIRVEGINSTIIRTDSGYTTQKATVYDAVCELLKNNGIPVSVQDSQYGKYVSAINNESAGTFGGYDGWLYAVNNTEGSVSMDSCSIKNGDDIAVYYGGYSPQTLIPRISLSTAEVETGSNFKVKINATYFDWDTNNNVTVNVTGAAINISDKKYTTDDNGEAVITAPEAAGSYTLEISQNRENNYPLLVRTGYPVKVVKPDYTVSRQKLAESLDKATSKLIEKFDDDSFNYQKHWMAIAINGFGKKVPGSYLQAIEKGDMPGANSGQYGKYILGILAAGGDPTNINGRDLLAELCNLRDMKNVKTEGGIYTTPFGLLALDAVDYKIPEDAGFTREDIINKLITLASPTGSEDGVGFVLTALGKYYNEKPEVKTAVDKVVTAWAGRQGQDGGFGAGAWSVENNVNTAAQVLMGLSFNGKDPQSGQFTKAKGNLVSFILSMQNEDGTFNWQKSNAGSISMATEQAVYALDQYLRQLDGKKSIYDFTAEKPDDSDKTAPVITTDLQNKTVNASVFAFSASANDDIDGKVIPAVKLGDDAIEGTNGVFSVSLKEGSNTITITAADLAGNKCEKSFKIIYELKVQGIPAEDKPKVKIPSDGNDYRIPVTAGDSSKEITIEIPENSTSKVLAQLPLNTGLPEIVVVKGNVTALFPKGLQVTNGSLLDIELITSKNADNAIKNKVNDIIPAENKLDSIEGIFSMGNGESIEFNGFVTLTFKDMQGKQAAYIQSGTLHPIQKYASDSAGLAGGRNEYAFDSGNDLIIKTKHFTDFIVYALSASGTPGNGGGTDSKKYVTLSVDKLTINKGYVVSAAQIELQSGDTAWTLLKRELDKRGISCKYIWTEAYGSVYVQSIAGDGEFDHGSGSGWMYAVNGLYPNYGATKYILKDGDKLQWRYTTNLGEDLGEDLSKWQDPTGNNSSENTSDGQGTSETDPAENTGGTQNTQSNTIDLKKLYSDEGFISSWAYKAVEGATQKGIVGGSNGKFNPKANITRAEFTKILVSSLGLDINIDKAINFNDVKDKDWFYPYVNAAYKAGIIKGSGNNFYPGDGITREQMAVMIIKALKIKSSEPAVAFKDIDQAASWAKADINTAASMKFMVGDNYNRFYPKGFATREMAVVVAMKVIDYKNGKSTENTGAKEAEIKDTAVKKNIEETGALMQKTVSDPVVGSIGGEWTVLSLARSGIKVPDSYYEKYYSNVEKKLKEVSGKLHNIKYTEYDRVILALSSIGKNAVNVAGYDLTKPLADFNTVVKQGLNGPVWALIALDSKGYQIPADNSVAVQTTRENLVDYILSKEIKGGGWSLTSEAPADTDITAMTLQALSKYRDNEKVEAAVERALSYLSAAQQEDASFKSAWEDGASSESIAQVIVALTALNINPGTDSRFIKNGNDTITALMRFYVKGGGFRHTLDGERDAMATDQGMYALVAYARFAGGKKPLYDMTE
jgi:prenyltransferase beta subunit